LEKIFVELLIEEMNYHLDVCVSGFGEEAWDRVCKEFNEETSLNYDKMELKKHLAILRKRYRIVKPLYNHGGFGWDYRRKMVDVDDGIWAEYIQVLFLKKKKKNYDFLDSFFLLCFWFLGLIIVRFSTYETHRRILRLSHTGNGGVQYMKSYAPYLQSQRPLDGMSMQVLVGGGGLAAMIFHAQVLGV
jgi:hypothetical protein